MKAHCEFSSEVLEKAIYEINHTKFKFAKRGSKWECDMDELPNLIETIDESLHLPLNYDTPPIKIRFQRWLITIKQGDNKIELKKTLMTKFLKELREVYEVYG